MAKHTHRPRRRGAAAPKVVDEARAQLAAPKRHKRTWRALERESAALTRRQELARSTLT